MFLQHGLSEESSSYTINQSLRLRASNSANLSRTYTSNATWTFSSWIKRGAMAVISPILGDTIKFNANDTLTAVGLTTTAVFRDPSAWYHIHVSNGGLYVNGVSFGAVTTSALTNTKIGTNGTNYFDGYIAHPYFIDSTSSSYNNFGITDAVTGIWIPKAFSGSYGTTGGFWPFNDATSLTTLGYDRSGNGNNWTCNGISITAGATYDVMKDSPTNGLNEVGNYATLNPLDKGSGWTVVDGNLVCGTAGSVNNTIKSSMYVSSGSYYCEITSGSNVTLIGVAKQQANLSNWLGSDIYGWSYYALNGSKYNNAVGTAYGSAYNANDIIGIKLDMDSGTLGFLKNNVSQGVAFTGLSGPLCIAIGCVSSIPVSNVVNFGQRPFAYAPPTGFKPLHTGNLPVPTVKNGADHFQVKLDTGANIKTTCEAVFTNELEWIKDRANSNNHQLIDSVRGSNAVLQSNTTAAETTYVAPSGSSVGWVWRASDSAPVTNTDGSITSTVSANVAAGFSVVKYLATGVTATVGHGLNDALKFIIIKGTNGALKHWIMWHTGYAATDYLLFTIGAKVTDATVWNSATPTSSVFSIGTNSTVNTSTNTYVAYCFAEIPGYSKFGSYVGNGSTDGPFVYCGFRPRWVMIKRIDATGNWTIQDSSRDNGYNVSQSVIYPHLTNIETTSNAIDYLSNGFKFRNSTTEQNTGTFIYVAFSESPFALNNRAR